MSLFSKQDRNAGLRFLSIRSRGKMTAVFCLIFRPPDCTLPAIEDLPSVSYCTRYLISVLSSIFSPGAVSTGRSYPSWFRTRFKVVRKEEEDRQKEQEQKGGGKGNAVPALDSQESQVTQQKNRTWVTRQAQPGLNIDPQGLQEFQPDLLFPQLIRRRW